AEQRTRAGLPATELGGLQSEEDPVRRAPGVVRPAAGTAFSGAALHRDEAAGGVRALVRPAGDDVALRAGGLPVVAQFLTAHGDAGARDRLEAEIGLEAAEVSVLEAVVPLEVPVLADVSLDEDQVVVRTPADRRPTVTTAVPGGQDAARAHPLHGEPGGARPPVLDRQQVAPVDVGLGPDVERRYGLDRDRRARRRRRHLRLQLVDDRPRVQPGQRFDGDPDPAGLDVVAGAHVRHQVVPAVDAVVDLDQARVQLRLAETAVLVHGHRVGELLQHPDRAGG